MAMYPLALDKQIYFYEVGTNNAAVGKMGKSEAGLFSVRLGEPHE